MVAVVWGEKVAAFGESGVPGARLRDAGFVFDPYEDLLFNPLVRAPSGIRRSPGTSCRPVWTVPTTNIYRRLALGFTQDNTNFFTTYLILESLQ